MNTDKKGQNLRDFNSAVAEFRVKHPEVKHRDAQKIVSHLYRFHKEQSGGSRLLANVVRSNPINLVRNANPATQPLYSGKSVQQISKKSKNKQIKDRDFEGPDDTHATTGEIYVSTQRLNLSL